MANNYIYKQTGQVFDYYIEVSYDLTKALRKNNIEKSYQEYCDKHTDKYVSVGDFVLVRDGKVVDIVSFLTKGIHYCSTSDYVQSFIKDCEGRISGECYKYLDSVCILAPCEFELYGRSFSISLVELKNYIYNISYEKDGNIITVGFRSKDILVFSEDKFFVFSRDEFVSKYDTSAGPYFVRELQRPMEASELNSYCKNSSKRLISVVCVPLGYLYYFEKL